MGATYPIRGTSRSDGGEDAPPISGELLVTEVVWDENAGIEIFQS